MKGNGMDPRQPQAPLPPPPDVLLGGAIEVRMVPNEATVARVEALRAAGVDLPPIGALSVDEIDVLFVLRGAWGAPNRFSQQMPQATIDIKELHRIPLSEFKRRAAEAFKKAGMGDFTAAVDGWKSSLPTEQ